MEENRWTDKICLQHTNHYIQEQEIEPGFKEYHPEEKKKVFKKLW